MKYILKSGIEEKPYLLRNYDDNLPVIYLSNNQHDFLTSKARTFFCVTYLLNISEVIDRFDNLTHWAFTIHDKDKNEDGSAKKTHVHLLLYFAERVSASYVAYILHSVEVKVISRQDISSEFNYLIHDSKSCRKQKKHLYDYSERIVDDLDYWQSRCVAVTDNERYVNMLRDFCNRQKSIYELLRLYGRDFLCNIRNLSELSRYVSYYDSRYIIDQNGNIMGKVDESGVIDDEF